MLSDHSTLLIILGYFIIVVVCLAIFWRIATALDQISSYLKAISEELKKRAEASNKDPK